MVLNYQILELYISFKGINQLIKNFHIFNSTKIVTWLFNSNEKTTIIMAILITVENNEQEKR